MAKRGYRLTINVEDIPDNPSAVVRFAKKKFIKWRGNDYPPIQKRIVAEILNASTPFVFLSAPTGSGKSLIGMAVAAYWVKLTGERAIYITKDTHLQEQIRDEFNVPVVMGRSNYPCPHTGKDASECPFSNTSQCPIVKKLISCANELEGCKGKGRITSIYEVPDYVLRAIWDNDQDRCHYLYWRELARRAPISVLNYHYAFYGLVMNKVLREKWPRPGLLIIDEAHLFSDFLIDQYSESFPFSRFNNLPVTIETLRTHLSELAEKYRKDLNESKDPTIIAELSKAVGAYDAYISEYEIYASLFDGWKPIPQEVFKSAQEYLNTKLDKFKKDFAEVLVSRKVVDEIKENLSALEAKLTLFVEFTTEAYAVFLKQTLRQVRNALRRVHGSEELKHYESLLKEGSLPNKLDDEWAYYFTLMQFADTPEEIIDGKMLKDFEKLTTSIINGEFGAHVSKEVLERTLELVKAFNGIKRTLNSVSNFNRALERALPKIANPESPLPIILPNNRSWNQIDEDSEYVLTISAQKKDDNIEYSINIKVLFPRSIFRWFWELMGKPKIVFMSATLIPQLLANMLGIDESEYTSLEVGSLFPKENRPVIPLAVMCATRSALNDEEKVKKYIQVLDSILDKTKGYRGIILIPSKKDFDLLVKYSRHKKRLLYSEGGAEDKKRALKDLAATKDGILVSPSIWEGADLKDDLSRFQIVFKVPFADLSDVATMLRAKLNRQWYELSALNTIIQGAGRSIRSQEDWAVTIILDTKFLELKRKYDETIPSWFKEAIIAPQKLGQNDKVTNVITFVENFLTKKN